MQYILAIDQGTTGSRAIVYGKNGEKIASAYEEFPQYFPRPGWVEHNPEEIWNSVNNSIQKVLAQIKPGDIAAIGITNQRETTVLWDRNTGKPVYNAIVWQCRRTAERCNKLKAEKGNAKLVKQKTGLPIDAYFSATKIEWILKNVPEVKANSKKGKLLFGTTDSWVLWKLTGGKVHATDYTNASRTMTFNINNLQWDSELLNLFGINKKMLPEVKKSSGEFGKTIKIGALPENIPITGIAGDQQAALFGQTCFLPGEVKNTYGTGCFMLMNIGSKKKVSKNGLITTICCDKSGNPAYALEGAVFIAGAAVQWLRDQLKIIASAPETEQLALSVPDNEGVYFVPAFVGLGAPYWDQSARGAIYGITRGTNRAHFVRAALEAMCYQSKDVLQAMEKDSGLKIKELKIDGGAVANNFLCQYQADILQSKVIRPTVIETTSLGAAYLAGLAVDYWEDAEEIKKCWSVNKEFKPELNRQKSAAYYQGWQKAVQRTINY